MQHENAMHDLWAIPFIHPWGCLCCRHCKGGHEHYEVGHPSLRTLLCNIHDMHFVPCSSLEVDW